MAGGDVASGVGLAVAGDDWPRGVDELLVIGWEEGAPEVELLAIGEAWLPLTPPVGLDPPHAAAPKIATVVSAALSESCVIWI
ncbi:MAG TPA: hypothetical protein VG015_05515 [Candidatus Dormibacteraeota bacterium]|nr:hypothetical protein [Candidatus Dormibacteraeota bacterium]